MKYIFLKTKNLIDMLMSNVFTLGLKDIYQYCQIKGIHQTSVLILHL